MKISVIIPSFNRADFLVKTIQSILNQTYQASEIIIIDDGSTDDTKEIIQKLNNPLIKYYFQKKSGVSSARNLGISKSSFEWMAFCDSDDLWLKDKLKNQTQFLHSNPQILFCHTNEIWKRNKKTINQKSYHKKPSGHCFLENIKNTLIGASTVLLHKSIFEKVGLFDTDLIACEDYDMWLKISRYYQIGLIDEAQIIKQAGHDGQLSFETPLLDIYRIKALKKQLIYKEHYDEVETEYQKRVSILKKGAIKHDNLEILNYL